MTQNPGPSLEQFGYRQELKRALTTTDLVVYGLVFMVPIAPFAIFGFVSNDSHGMVPLAYVLGVIGMLFTALSYAYMSRAFPMAGSVYSYVGRGLHEVAGFFAGWLILLDYLLVPSLLYIMNTVALHPLFPAVPAWLWIAGFAAFCGIVNLVGVQLTARINRYLLISELIVLVLFIAIGLHALYGGQGAGALTLKPIYNPAAFSISTVAAAASIAVLSFLGFDGISTLAEENRDGVNAVGRATLLALVLAALLFVSQTWIATDLAQGMRFNSPETAFYEITERAGGSTLRVITVIMVVVADIANAMVAQAAVSRILFAMARDGKLPGSLARVHPVYQTPWISTLVVATLSLVVGIVFSQHIVDLPRIVNFGALTGFVLLHLSVIHHFLIRGRSGDWRRHLLVPLGGLIVIGFVLLEMDNAAKIMGGCWIAIGVVYFAVMSLWLRRPAALEI